MNMKRDLQILVLGIIMSGFFSTTTAAGMMTGYLTGMLTGSSGHTAAGKVTLDSEGATLTFSDLKVDRVPDGRVYLAKDGDYRQGLELGLLKYFTGTVSFMVPAGTTSDDFNSVVIWCEKFSVEIGRAYLR
jgi:hypothetical protein